MRTLYLNCQTGIAGDMTVATLLTHVIDKESFLKKVNQLFPSYDVSYESITRYEKNGLIMKMLIGKEEEENHDLLSFKMTGQKSQLPKEETGLMPQEVLENFPISKALKKQVWQIFMTILKEQEIVHQKKMTNIHFTKLGSLDALLDITTTCLLVEELKIDRIISTPVNTGFGQVQYGDKIFNVPAPVTKRIIKDLPHFHNELEGELCTPTGVALLKNLTDEFIAIPEMAEKMKSSTSVGRSFGLKIFPFPSYLESFVIED